MTTFDDSYFTEKYGLTRTHSEVLHAMQFVKPGKTLDWAAATGVTASIWRPMGLM